MKTYDPRKPLISIHIPKCAGTSFSNVLKSWFGKGFRSHYHNEKLDKPPERYALHTGLFSKNFKYGMCIHGHFNNARGIGVYDYYPETDQFITIIRNPFDLHISNYFYVRRLAKQDDAYRSGKQHAIIEKGWSLEDYLLERKKSYICNFLPPNITLDNYRQVLDEQFIFVGITENIQDSVNILAQKLNFPALKVPEANVSDWNERIPDGAQDEFIRHNPLEMAIYSYIKNSFEQHLAQLKTQPASQGF